MSKFTVFVLALSALPSALCVQNVFVKRFSTIFVNELASYHASNVNAAEASSVAGHLFDSVANDPVINSAVLHALEQVLIHGGRVSSDDALQMFHDGAAAFTQFSQEAAYPSLITYFKQHSTDFDINRMSSAADSLMRPHIPEMQSFFSSLEADPVGKEILQSAEAIGGQVASDFGIPMTMKTF